MTTTHRPTEPANRVTVANVADWWDIRARHDELAGSSHHHIMHILKVTGMVAGMLEHRDHGEPEDKPADFRYADLIIHAIRLAECEGYNAAEIVSNRMWQLGIAPIPSELPRSERRFP